MRFQFRPTVLCGLACFALVAAAVAIAAPPEAAPPADPKARQLLDEVIKAYKGLGSYSDQGQFVLELTDNGKPTAQSTPLKLSFTRPNKVDLDTGLVRMVSDGKTVTTSVAPLKQYTESPAPRALAFEAFRQGPVGSVLFGAGPIAPSMHILLNLLVGDDPAKAIAEIDGTLKMGAQTKQSASILIDRSEGPDFELVIDPASKLLKSIRLLIDPKLLASTEEPGRKVTLGKFGWEAGTLSTKPIKDAAYAFSAPKDFTKVESFAQAGEEGEAVKKLVGKPAPDFTLTVLDGSKTRTLTKADLAGKVVMIDFWATWCGPCIKELPEVQKMIESYAKDNKDVLIVALNQDSEPNDVNGVRKVVEEKLKEEKVTLTGNKTGLIALDPSGTIGNAFSVEVIPTLVILDGKGMVQSVHVGEQTRETLSKDIDALLAGKSLVTPKPDEAAAKKN